ncbi:MAG: protein phosphatase 2C domain-containing protein [Oligoflexia bacterium]|nr:protein phosphatase 2C domain-containing protein [Oligoflexia bacterium]
MSQKDPRSQPVPVKASAVFLSAGNRFSMEDCAVVNEEKRIFVIADGFGGPQPGATAAKTSCEAVQGFLCREAGDEDATLPFVLKSYFSLAGNVLFNSLVHANRKVQALNKGKGVHERGGASVLAGFMDDDLLALANVGACSAWLFRDGKSRELVTPRTLGRLQDPFAEGAQIDPTLQVPLSAVGIKDDLEPEIFEVRVRPGDWLIFMTDGLPAAIREKLLRLQIDSAGALAGDSCQSALKLLKAAEAETGTLTDNTGVALVIF